MASGFVLVGEKALQKRLSRIGKQSTVNRMARPAMREASGEIRKLAKFYAQSSQRTGLLRKSIKNVVRTGKNGVYAVIGPANGFKTTYMGEPQDPTKYAHLVEYGTTGHFIRPTKGRALAFWGKDGQRRFLTGGVYHKSTAPKPFLRPAYDSVNSQAIIGRRLSKELEREARRT